MDFVYLMSIYTFPCARRITEPLIYNLGDLNVRARNTWLSLDGVTFGVSFVF